MPLYHSVITRKALSAFKSHSEWFCNRASKDTPSVLLLIHLLLKQYISFRYSLIPHPADIRILIKKVKR